MKDKFKLLSEKLLFEVDKEVVKEINEKWENLDKQIEKMALYPTENILPMERVDQTPTSFLREDEFINEVFAKDKLLKNAPNKNEDFIIIKKGKA